MDKQAFEDSLTRPLPPSSLSEAAQGLWWDRREDWDAAHVAVQAGSDASAAWVHAYLHRKEGDLPNSDYWYERAGRTRPNTSLDNERDQIIDALLGDSRDSEDTADTGEGD